MDSSNNDPKYYSNEGKRIVTNEKNQISSENTSKHFNQYTYASSITNTATVAQNTNTLAKEYSFYSNNAHKGNFHKQSRKNIASAFYLKMFILEVSVIWTAKQWTQCTKLYSLVFVSIKYNWYVYWVLSLSLVLFRIPIYSNWKRGKREKRRKKNIVK